MTHSCVWHDCWRSPRVAMSGIRNSTKCNIGSNKSTRVYVIVYVIVDSVKLPPPLEDFFSWKTWSFWWSKRCDFWPVLTCVVVCCSAVQCVAVCWSALQGVVVRYSALHCDDVLLRHVQFCENRTQKNMKFPAFDLSLVHPSPSENVKQDTTWRIRIYMNICI